MNLVTNGCEPVVVIPAFRREKSLERLLNSIERIAGNSLPKLIISIEGDASTEVKNTALNFSSQHNLCEIIEHPQRLGLRKHIVYCGDLALKYGSAIVLEDDLIVDPNFFEYAKQALSHYENDESIAGIALYAPELNEFSGFPFRPMRSDFDTYLMRTPCSWGQLWTRKQWIKFKSWYEKPNIEELLGSATIPPEIKQWPESSWKKYFAAYMSLEKLDFVYPYQALSTNCADYGGMHMERGSNLYQVALPLPNRTRPHLSFCHRESEACVSYDEFMEPNGSYIYNWLGLQSEEVAIDLYGAKPISLLRSAKYVITTKAVKKYERRIGVRFRPIERNLLPPYETNDNANVYSIYFLKSEDLKEHAQGPIIGAYSYFSGMNLDSLSASIKFSLRLPLLFASAIFRKIKTKFKI